VERERRGPFRRVALRSRTGIGFAGQRRSRRHQRQAQQGSRDAYGDLDARNVLAGIHGKLDPSMVVNREVL
jgi:hypothetical protein